MGYLTFSSNEPFTIHIEGGDGGWDGFMEYSTNAAEWQSFGGSAKFSSAEHNGEQRIYVRGTGNTVVSIGYSTWVLTGSQIRCDGNIENLLDYKTVLEGKHPVMGTFCFDRMFSECESLIKAPELPATTLTWGCYDRMFYYCTNLIIPPPELPATTLAESCYESMFHGCKKLKKAPNLPAMTTQANCYYRMFALCESLEVPPELPATTLTENCYYRMFWKCTGLKISESATEEYTIPYRLPAEGDGIIGDGSTNSLDRMFEYTGGTFTGTPEMNKTYYLEAPAPVSPVHINPSMLMQGFVWMLGVKRMRGTEAGDITDAELVDGVLYIKNAVATLNQNVLEVV